MKKLTKWGWLYVGAVLAGFGASLGLGVADAFRPWISIPMIVMVAVCAVCIRKGI